MSFVDNSYFTVQIPKSSVGQVTSAGGNPSVPVAGTALVSVRDVKNAKEAQDDKNDKKVLNLNSLKMLKMVGSGSRGKGALKPVRAWCVQSGTITGAANANAFPVVIITPIGSTDFSSFAALYDVCRVMEIDFKFRIGYSGVAPTGGDIAVAWDPSNSGAYASMNDVLTAYKHFGPVGVNTNAAVAPGYTNIAFTETGYYGMKVKLPTPKELIANDNLTEKSVGGGWIATSSTNFDVGFFKFAITAFGSGSTSSGIYYARQLIEFKCRT